MRHLIRNSGSNVNPRTTLSVRHGRESRGIRPAALPSRRERPFRQPRSRASAEPGLIDLICAVHHGDVHDLRDSNHGGEHWILTSIETVGNRPADPEIKAYSHEMASADSSAGTITIKRGRFVQDVIRRYLVLIDGRQVGKLWALQTGAYAVDPGEHRVQLKLSGGGTAASEEIPVSIASGADVVVRTLGRPSSSAVQLGLSLPAGLKAQLSGTPIDSRFYKGPWIHLEVES